MQGITLKKGVQEFFKFKGKYMESGTQFMLYDPQLRTIRDAADREPFSKYFPRFSPPSTVDKLINKGNYVVIKRDDRQDFKGAFLVEVMSTISKSKTDTVQFQGKLPNGEEVPVILRLRDYRTTWRPPYLAR